MSGRFAGFRMGFAAAASMTFVLALLCRRYYSPCVASLTIPSLFESLFCSCSFAAW